MASSELGPWTGDDLAATAAANPDVGADAGLPVDVRFKGGVAKLVRRRRVQSGAEADAVSPAIFILGALPENLLEGATRVPWLDNGLTSVTGRVWFVPPNLGVGHCVETADLDDDSLVRWICGDVDAGNVPTMVFDPRPANPEVRFHPAGLNQLEFYEIVTLAANVTLEDVMRVVESVHGHFLMTPRRQTAPHKLWAQTRRRWAADNAEKAVQHYLLIALQGVFSTTTVKDEGPLISGRYDLEIVERRPEDNTVVHHVLLELKVLREFGSTGNRVTDREIAAHVRDGVVQASSYAREEGAREYALCCFDLRNYEPPDCFRGVRALATRLSVRLTSWPVFASAREYREFLIATS